MKKKKKFGMLLREYFVFYGIIPAFTISVLLLGFVFFFQRYSIKREIKERNNQVGEKLEFELNKQKDFIRQFAASEQVIDFFVRDGNINVFYEDFYAFNMSTDMKCVLNLLDTESNVISSSMKFSDRYSREGLGLITERIKKYAPDVLNESNLIEYPAGELSVYTLGAAVMDEGGIVGYVMIQTLDEGLQAVLKPGDMLCQITVDKFDRIISMQNTMEHRLKEQFLPDENSFYLNAEKDQYYYEKWSLPEYDITVYTAGSWNYFQQSYVMSIVFLAVVLFLLIFLVNIISKKVSKKVTDPIDNLVMAFSHLKDGETGYLADFSNPVDEFDFLSDEYNRMLNKLNLLMKRNEELSEIRRIAEIKQLEAQFDPHFFLNMLESLRYMSFMSKEEAERMILSLSSILRYSLYNHEQYASVEEDMKYVEDYLYLQTVRIGSNFTYRIQIDQQVNGLIVPKLLIQPLIENSIKHGYQGVPGFCVNVLAYVEGEDLLFEVRDNGKGITQEKTEQLFTMLKEGTKEHIGLCNIHKRLEYMYGEGYGIQSIDGREGFYIVVRMRGGRDISELQGFGGRG